MKSPKVQFPSQCKNSTDRYGSTNYPLSCSDVFGKQLKFSKFWGLHFAMVPCLQQCKFYIKRKLRVWRNQKCNFLVSAKTAPTDTGQQTTPCHVVPYRVSNENFWNFVATFYHGIVFALMQSLYENEATGVERPKMQFLSQCKNRTDRCGSTNYPVPCSAVLGKH